MKLQDGLPKTPATPQTIYSQIIKVFCSIIKGLVLAIKMGGFLKNSVLILKNWLLNLSDR